MKGLRRPGRPACKRWRAAAAPGPASEGCLTINCLPDELMLKVNTLHKHFRCLSGRFLTTLRCRPGGDALSTIALTARQSTRSSLQVL